MYIQKRFVQAQWLDQRRERKEDVTNLPPDLGVVLHPNGKKDALRTEPPRRRCCHSAVDAELAGFVGRGANDASALDAANDHRLATQFGVVTLFHGRIKGVHIDMQEWPGPRQVPVASPKNG